MPECRECNRPVCQEGRRCKSCAQKLIKSDRPRLAVVVDERFREVVEKTRWYLVRGYVKGHPFGRDRPQVPLHQYVWFLENGVLAKGLDHVNCDRQDNRLENLRQATLSLQAHNRPKQPRPRRKGHRWEASIMRSGVVNYRSFGSESEASAWLKNAREVIIEFEALESLD